MEGTRLCALAPSAARTVRQLARSAHDLVAEMNSEAIEVVIGNLWLEVALIEATLSYRWVSRVHPALRARAYFEQAVAARRDAGLVPVQVPQFVGLGAVRYIPALLRAHRASMSADLHRQVDSFTEAVLGVLQAEAAPVLFQVSEWD